jgi:transposase InsO family protein
VLSRISIYAEAFLSVLIAPKSSAINGIINVFTAGRVTRYLNKLAEYHGYAPTIRVDNGSEFTGKTFIDWAKSHGITIDYIQAGSPYQNRILNDLIASIGQKY